MDKSALAVLIIGLVVIWVFASSINVLIKVNQGRGSSRYTGLPINVGIPQPPIVLPPINITIPQHVNLTRANEVYVPLVPVPIIIPNLQVSLMSHISISLPKPQLAITGGSAASGTSVGAGNSQSSSHIVTVTFNIPPTLLIALLVSVIIIIAVSSLVIVRRSTGRPRTVSEPSRGPSTRLSLGEELARNEVVASPINVELLPGESVSRLEGWGGNPIIELAIPKDLPLIWGYGEPLPISWKEGYTVSVAGPGEIKGGLLYMPKPGCYAIRAEGGGGVETLFIRAVDYGEDVARLVKLNVGAHGVEDSLTVREAMRRLLNDGLVSGGPDVNRVVRIFEEARYGFRRVDRASYEDFLRSLGRAFRDARVIVCAPQQAPH